MGKAKDKLRINPRKAWYHNVKEITANGDFEAVFHLERPQPALVTLLASGYSPIYPCHVSPRDMRTHPIGTGPFKFVEFKPNETIKVARNPEYWKTDRPYLDGIEYTIIPNRSTALLAFESGKFDMTWPFVVTVPLLKDVKSQAPQAICELKTNNGSDNLIVNRDKPPFDNAGPAPGHGARLGPQGIHRHPHRRPRQDWRRHAAAAGGAVGHAAGNVGDPARLWSGRAKEPGRCARDHGKARLRARKAAGNQSGDTQRCHLPRPGGHPDRPAQGDLHRR